ncbi:tripartite motif-containing protein 5-like [Oncorhynchus nerka]|uniref:tripartite motif-containing protein 5-like n=1 Tax=Oncorhynchus nerka TaxID=8023 RepID=UPI001131655E|nr:tripartite motif-containing protein 16-like [Oncorhynchus nerka]
MRRTTPTRQTRFPPPFVEIASTATGIPEVKRNEVYQVLPEIQAVCDMCVYDKKPALKTCIKCEMSMCAQHLEPHLTVPLLLQTHTLTEPIAPGAGGVGAATKCPQHGKILEYYCLDDLTSACMSCAIEDQHRVHNMKTLPKAHKELGEKLKEEQKKLAQRERQIQELGRWDKEQRERLASSSVRLIEGVSVLRDITLTSVKTSVSARIVSINTSKRTMQAALSDGDSFRFLQGYAGVHQAVENARAVDLRKGLEPGADQDRLVQELQQSGGKLVEQMTQLWSSLLALVDPQKKQKAQGSTTMTFDPKSLGRGMSLSQDHRKVFYTPLANLTAHTLLCQDSGSDANPRWVVKLSEDCDWTIGLCVNVSSSGNDNVFALRWQKGQLSSQADLKSQLIYLPGKTAAQPETIPRPIELEVFWDKTSNPPSLSFYSRGRYHQRTELHRMEIKHHQGDLTPFVTLGTGSSSARVRQSSARLLESFNQLNYYGEYGLYGANIQPELQWGCPCGEVHEHPKIQQSFYHQHVSQQDPMCTCKRVIGTPYMGVFCELV